MCCIVMCKKLKLCFSRETTSSVYLHPDAPCKAEVFKERYMTIYQVCWLVLATAKILN